MFEANQTARDHFDSYSRKLNEARKSIQITELDSLYLTLLELRGSKRKLFLAGNGGSASTSQHFAVDLGVGGIGRNSIIRAYNLSDNQGGITAIANDRNFDRIYSDQLTVLGEPEDVLIVISASGNSLNLLNAADKAKEMGITTIGLLGFDGGKLREICDQSVLVETEVGEYGIVEDVHLSICHSLTEALRRPN